MSYTNIEAARQADRAQINSINRRLYSHLIRQRIRNFNHSPSIDIWQVWLRGGLVAEYNRHDVLTLLAGLDSAAYAQPEPRATTLTE